MTTHREADTTASASRENVALYVHEEGSEELLHAVYDADDIPIPDVGDRVSFVEAETDGTLSERSVEYSETDDSRTFVVQSREFVYLQIDHGIEDLDQAHQLLTEVHLTVTVDE